MKNLLTQIKNEWRSNLFLLVELLLVFAVLWYIVDWVTVTARVIALRWALIRNIAIICLSVP